MKTCPLCDTAYPNHQSNCTTDGALLIESRELEPGTLIRGKYRIVRLLGRGGMGTVYLADHILLGRQRALKFISSELSQDPRFLKRFRHEAQAASELRQANVVEVVDLDQAEDGSPYIAMEFVDGLDLRHVLAAGAFPVERAVAIARGIALGLSAAHAKGIIHRDVKPENILLARGSGGYETPKLLDFGIAAMKESATAVSRTRGLMLTPEYASPEQWRGMPAEELDCRTDLYALGGVLYEMLTGQTAFHAHNTEGWMYQHLHEEPQPPSQLRPELKKYPGLDALVLRLLAKDREQRFATAAAVLEALALKEPAVRPRTIVEDTSEPVPESEPEVRPSRSWKWAVPASLAFAGMGIWLAMRFLLPASATAVPVLTPGSGTYAAAQPIVISDATPNAVIHYTVDGSSPSETSTVYSEPVTSLPSGAVLRAMAKAEGHAPSPDITAVYIWSGGGASKTADKAPGGSAYDRGKFAYDHKQYAEARTLFGSACDGGESKGCNYLGFLLAQGLGGAPDKAKARAVWVNACDREDMRSCASLGSLYQDAKDNANARKYFQKACDGKLAEACDLLRGVE